MIKPNKKLLLTLLLFVSLAMLAYSEIISAQIQGSQVCEQCGMEVKADAQAHFKVVDGAGKTHYVCCIKCAFKLLTKVGELDITTNCDWYGPDYPITINVRGNLSSINVNPSTALIIDGNCMKNRVVYNQTAASALLANNGISQYLVASQNTTIPSDATLMSIAQAVRTFGTSQSPSPSPTSPALTQECETCGMAANAEAQARYKVTDGNGNIHYVECFMCALNLINDYKQLHIVTCCDWYGPTCTITIDSANYGAQTVANPSNAMFLNGGNCVINRAAYNLTAAEALLANGFSQYTLVGQQFALPSETKVLSVEDAAKEIARTNASENDQNQGLLIIIGIVGVAIVVGTIISYKKLKTSTEKKKTVKA